jgi:hypothetical protein
MGRIVRFLSVGALASTLSIGDRAEAAFTFTFKEQGDDVVAIGSGSVDLADLTKTAEDNLPASGVSAQDGLAGVSGMVAVYAGIVGPLNFGAGGHVVASTGGGDPVAINGAKGFLGVPLHYVSGAPLSNSMEFDGRTFDSLGLTPGTYAWSWGSGANADSLTVQISAAAIPEPSSGLALAVGLLGLAALRLRKPSLASPKANRLWIEGAKGAVGITNFLRKTETGLSLRHEAACPPA